MLYRTLSNICWISIFFGFSAYVCAADPVYPKIPTAEEIKNVPLPQIPTQEQLKKAPIPKTPDMKDLDLGHPMISVPNITPLLEMQPKKKVNPEDFMQAYKDMQPQPHLLSQGHIYVFVSFSLPKASLDNLITEAERVGATLVLRGLHENSMRKTAIKIMETMGKRKVSWQVDPPSFTRFEVKAVPVIALMKVGAVLTSCQSDKCEKPSLEYGMVSGDVSIEYAIETISKRKPSLDAEAKHFLAKLRGQW